MQIIKDTSVFVDGRKGKVVAIVPIDLLSENNEASTANMLEIAFPGQLWTECFWETEATLAETVPFEQITCHE